MVDPVVEAAALQRVVHVAGAVRRDHDERRHVGAERAELGHRDRVVGQHLEQERLELVVGAVDLVDQEDRRRPLAVVDRLQQRPAHEEALGVELVFERVGRRVGADLAGGLGRAQVQQLAGVVPLVHGLRGVEALVALQAQQVAARSSGRAPWPPRSCRRPPRLRAAAAGAGAWRGRSPSRGPRRRSSRARRAHCAHRRRSRACAPALQPSLAA